MKRNAVIGLSIAVFLLATGTQRAYADPLTITSGSIAIVLEGFSSIGSTFSIAGEGFSLSGFGEHENVTAQCNPCRQSEVISLSGATGGQNGPTSGPAVFDSVSYPQLFLNGQFTITSPSFSVAALAPSLTVTQPFSLTGALTAFRTGADAFNGFPSVGTAHFIGSGTVTAQFARVPTLPGQPDLFRLSTARFEFANPAAAPTPEPASVLLLATGIAAVAIRRQR